MKCTKPDTKFYVLVLCLVAVYITESAIWHTLAEERHLQQKKSESESESITQNTATSGSLFTGAVIREFPEAKIVFHSQRAPRTEKIVTSKQYEECEKWAVVTTIFSPSEAVMAQANLQQGWCTVVVADKKTPLDFMETSLLRLNPRVVFLDTRAQQDLGLQFPELSKLIPWNHFGRKNLGYLFAIMHGAEIVWDFDDDNIVVDAEHFHAVSTLNHSERFTVNFPAAANTTACERDAQSHNIYFNFNSTAYPDIIWPRGLPLPDIKCKRGDEASSSSQSSSYTIQSTQVAIVQSLANLDPDVDSIYRLTNKLPVTFQSGHMLFAVPKNKFTPLNAQACLFKYQALWMLLLPISVHGRVSDIWRGYIGQRILAELNLHVLFSSPLVDQLRNPHNYLADFQAELPLFLQSGALLQALGNWSAKPPTRSLQRAIEQLWIDVYNRGMVELEDVFLIQQWLLALESIGYEFPELRAAEETKIPLCLSERVHWPDLELFVPMPPTDESVHELRDLFLDTLWWFWPKEHISLRMVTDAEHPRVEWGVSQFLLLTKDVIGAERARVSRSAPPPTPMHGHDRQQWMMFWADNFTESEFVGFVDTDTVFVTRVLLDDLFVLNETTGLMMPRARVVYGKPVDSSWQRIPEGTLFATGFKEKFKAMTYFPVVVRTADLQLVRRWVCAAMGEQLFDNAFRRILDAGTDKYSQFNIIMNILYAVKHDEYFWHIDEQEPGWAGPAPAAQISSPEEGGLYAEEFQRPRAHLSMHWNHGFGSYDPGVRRTTIHELKHLGQCYGLKSSSSSSKQNMIPGHCKNLDVDNTLNHWEWVFEVSMFDGRPGCIEAHRQRRQTINSCPEHEFII